MSEELYNQFPVLKNFRSAIKRCDVSAGNADSFDKWRKGKKCLEGSPQRAEADRLWEEYQKIKDHAPPPPKNLRNNNRPKGGRGGRGPAPEKAVNRTAASAGTLGNSFHNPYTFIPFPQNPPKRGFPTPLTIDEAETDRFTGILELDIKTLSPLMTCSPIPLDPKSDHKTYPALSIGSDVVVPATGVKGALRSLMTILAGGNLGYLDEGLWLCQGRDAQLGPVKKDTGEVKPRHVFLARVERPGDQTRSGTVRLGETDLVKLRELERKIVNLDKKRPQLGKKIPTIWASSPKLEKISEKRTEQCPWQIKLSGRPINKKGKREGIFLAGSKTVELGAPFWNAYQGRNRHGDHPELHKGDLVWLEPASPELAAIRSASDVKSIQWARWGRHGISLQVLLERHAPQMIPDNMKADGRVDEVTNLFGQIPLVEGAAGPFASRIRPDNLVFRDCVKRVQRTRLAPLAPPHPGCVSFYRDNDDLDRISTADAPKGYKVYRTTKERGSKAPWHYEAQGVYDENGKLKEARQKVNKTCDLLDEGVEGKLRIALRSLSQRELAMVLICCAADWRLGGGKPFGLGHCRVLKLKLINEDGQQTLNLERQDSEEFSIPGHLLEGVDDLLKRLRVWQATQLPVPFLRYPRAVVENRNRLQRGGHVWFQRFSSPKKMGAGVEVLWTDGELKQKAEGKSQIRGQSLPSFEAENPQGNQLFGYDSLSSEGNRRKERNNVTRFTRLEPFDPQKHTPKNAKSGGFHGQNAESREHHKKQRRHN